MTYYITKRALNLGIITTDDIIRDHPDVVIKIINGRYLSIQGPTVDYYLSPKDWADTHEKAIIKANSRRDKKIKEREKDLEKLRNMVFI